MGYLRRVKQYILPHTVVSMIPFCLAIDRVEIALGSKNEIFAVSAETGR